MNEQEGTESSVPILWPIDYIINELDSLFLIKLMKQQ